jgi:hypothetical protein
MNTCRQNEVYALMLFISETFRVAWLPYRKWIRTPWASAKHEVEGNCSFYWTNRKSCYFLAGSNGREVCISKF